LLDLTVDEPRAVLEVGCGPGELARRLAPSVARVDAVDFSAGMLDLGQRSPGGDAQNLRWIASDVERAPLEPPYALIVAGESLHWMDWDVVMPRFAAALSEHGMLAIASRNWELIPALHDRMVPLYKRYTHSRDYQPFNTVEELQARGLFHKEGERAFARGPWQPTIDEYMQCRYSQQGFSRTHMGPEAVAGFDTDMRATLCWACQEGIVELRDQRLQLAVEGKLVWGTC
jgi:SAM-dependent methyltransferase